MRKFWVPLSHEGCWHLRGTRGLAEGRWGTSVMALGFGRGSLDNKASSDCWRGGWTSWSASLSLQGLGALALPGSQWRGGSQGIFWEAWAVL